MYAPAAENLEYIQTVAAENGFNKYMKFQHEILQASWTDEEAMWTLSVKDLKTGLTFDDKVHLFLELNGPVRYVHLVSQYALQLTDCFRVHPALRRFKA